MLQIRKRPRTYNWTKNGTISFDKVDIDRFNRAPLDEVVQITIYGKKELVLKNVYLSVYDLLKRVKCYGNFFVLKP